MANWQTVSIGIFSRLMLKPLTKREVSVARLRAQTRAMEWLYPRRPPGFELTRERVSPTCTIDHFRQSGSLTDRVILHFPGGAYITRMPRAEGRMLARICRAANAEGYLVRYRLAPEHPFPAGQIDCIAAYGKLMADGVPPDRIILSGISAGGGMALSVLFALRDQGLPLPAGLVAMSPFTDLTNPGEGSRLENRSRDDVLGRTPRHALLRIYADGDEEILRHPYVSPVLGDYRGLPPMLFQVGCKEILLDDTRRCADRARQAGVDAQVEEWPDVPHAWQAMSVLPESRRAVDRIGDFIRERCP